MKMILTFVLAISMNAFSHDEGHGPKLTDAPKQGGVVAPVVLAKEAGLGTKAQMKYKAEIARTQDGIVRIYFYDQAMNPLKNNVLAPKARAYLISGKKGKIKEEKFELIWKEDHFFAKSPKPTRKPYNIDVIVKEGSTELLVAFDNLD
jgi:hypothetical protein